MRDKDQQLIFEQYLLLELKNSKNTRAMFAKKFGVDEDKAGSYIEDFIEIQPKLKADRRGTDIFKYNNLDAIEQAIKMYQGDTARERKKENLIKWAQQHPRKLSENERGIAVAIDKHEDSRLFSQLTRWCTTTACSDNWDKYRNQNVDFIYIVNLDKTFNESDFFAIALYDKTWDSLYELHPEIAYIPEDETDTEFAPMFHTYKDVGGDPQDWVDEIEDAERSDYDYDDEEDMRLDIEKDFAIDFMNRWDKVTGGAVAMEAFNAEDESISAITVVNQFNIPNIFKGEVRIPAHPTAEDKEQALFDRYSHSIQYLVGKGWIRYRDLHPEYEGVRNPRWPTQTLKKRWPKLEDHIIKNLYDRFINNITIRPLSDPDKSNLGHYITMTMATNISHWPDFEQFATLLLEEARRSYTQLHNELVNKDGFHTLQYDQVQELINKHSIAVNAYSTMFTTIVHYYSLILPKTPAANKHKDFVYDLFRMITEVKRAMEAADQDVEANLKTLYFPKFNGITVHSLSKFD